VPGKKTAAPAVTAAAAGLVLALFTHGTHANHGPAASTAAHLVALRKAATGAGSQLAASFIGSVAPEAVDAQKQYGVPAAVTIAQAIDESDWGRSSLAAQYHNLFGIKGNGTAGSVTLPTQEYQNGSWVTVDAQFAVYNSDAESVTAHAQLLATSGYYTRAMTDKGNPDQFAADLTGVYATDPGYGGTLVSFMRAYNLYQYDQGGNTGQSRAGQPAVTLPGDTSPAVVAAINYALSQLGKPYSWGGTGPDSFDCSGLVMMAYQAAGVELPRTSQDQWAQGTRIPDGQEKAGDLVFFAGGDGTPDAPGHVGLVTGKNQMIEAYAAGVPVRVSTFGEPSSPDGDQQVVGFTRPAGTASQAQQQAAQAQPSQAPSQQQAPAARPEPSRPAAQPSQAPAAPAPSRSGSDGYADVPGVITPVLAPSGSTPQRPASGNIPGAQPQPQPSQSPQPGQAVIPGIPG